MIKQALWFALLGTAIALVGGIVGPALGATGDFGWSRLSGTTYGVAGLPYTVSGDRIDAWPWALAVTGAVIGLITGAVLFIVGVRTSTRTDNRMGRVVAAGLCGVAVGLSPVWWLFAHPRTASDRLSVLWWYAAGVVLAYGFALVAVHSVLRATDDTATTATTRASAIFLVGGAALATVGGSVVARILGYTTVPSTWIATVITAAAILAASFALARAHALRRWV